MPRIPRNLIKDQDRCYHIISRTTGQEFSLGDVEKEYLMQRIKRKIIGLIYCNSR